MGFIIHCTDAFGDDSQLGVQAKTLAVLPQQIDSIPNWFVVSPAAFEHCLDQAQRTA
jgi:citrate lyase beta subunit